jgi:hypothetical protein
MDRHSPQPPFVGESRIKLVDGLVLVLDEVETRCEARWVSLEAPSGWGKTRVAQELYARLAAREAEADTDRILVNDKPLDVDDVQGSFTEHTEQLPNAGRVKLRFSISDGKGGLRQPGICIRVSGKVVGKPEFFGLDEADDFPRKLLNKLYGEIEADGLVDHVTADWGALVDNSELKAEVRRYVEPIIRQRFKEVYTRDINLAQARLQRQVLRRAGGEGRVDGECPARGG